MLTRWMNFLLHGTLITRDDPRQSFATPASKDSLSELRKYPRFLMADADNIRSWWFVRIVLLDFGKPFYDRLSAYTAFFLLFEVGLILLVFLQSTFIPDLMTFEIQVLVAYYMIWINFYLVQTVSKNIFHHYYPAYENTYM